MSEPFLGEIKITSFNFPPKGWAFCNGQFLPINQNQALFSLLGTMYGGDGRVNFALPNLRGRVPIHIGNGRTEGNSGGATGHTVKIAEMPQHSHALNASSAPGDALDALNNVLASASNVYRTADNLKALSPGSVTSVGGSQPHNNMMPYLVLSFCIALQGIFPSRN